MSRQSDDSGSEMVLVSCNIERETPKALLITDEMNDEHWVPKSQCRRVAGGVEIKRWLIEKNGIHVGYHEQLAQGADYRRPSGREGPSAENDWSPIEEPGDDRFAPPAPDSRDDTEDDIPF